MGKLRKPIARLTYLTGKRRVLQYLDELDALQWRSRDDVIAAQHQHLLQLLKYANTYVPYYQELFRRVGFHPSDYASDPAGFERIPLLTKDMIRNNRERLVTTEQDRRRALVPVKTGGTTGEPMWVMHEPSCRDYNSAHLYHVMTWSGWRLGEPQAWLWGHPVVGTNSNGKLLTRLRDWLAYRIGSNAFNMTEESLEALARQIEQHPGGVLSSYVSTMYRFAEFVENRGHKLRLRAAYVGAEPVYDYQRQRIEEALGCPVFDNYSCVEIGSIACECEEHDGLHITTRNCYVEVLRDGQPVPDGEEGEFVLTHLTNFGFPLIRYQIEDWGTKSTRECGCGRGLPVLDIVEGRIIDHFKTKDGRLVWAAFLIPMVPALGGVKQFQIVQKSHDLVVLRVIKDGPIKMAKFEEIKAAAKAILGDDTEVDLEFVDHLPKTPTGKHRFTVSEVH